jgi:uncharacterized protein
VTEKIVEIILVSQNSDGSAHLAPFGIRYRDKEVLIAPYKPSITLENLLSGRSATINMTSDVRIFAGAVTGRYEAPVKDYDGVWGLEGASRVQQIELDRVFDDPIRPELYFKLGHQYILDGFDGFNRASHAVLELSILVTRLNRLPIQEVRMQMNQLQIILDKTAGEKELEAWRWLQDAIDHFESTQ